MSVFTGIYATTTESHKTVISALYQNEISARLKRWVSVCFLVMMMLASVISKGQVTLPHLEAIPYATGGLGLNSQSGWTTLNSGDSLLISAGSLSSPSLPASTGNKVTFDGAGIDAAKLFTQQTSGTVYYSFLLNVTALGSLGTAGGYFTGFTEGISATFGATVWTRKDVNATGYDIGINPKTTAANTAWSSAQTINNTVFVVISYQMVPNTLNDVVKLWINPATGGSEPAATLSATNALASDLANINRILIRQDAAAATPFIQMDELRIGTDWASVTPSGTAPVVTAASPTGTVGASFTYNISATGSPTSYAIFSGTLPAGLSLNTTSGAITGTPTTAGASSVDVTATNGVGTSTPATLSFTINPGSQTITGLAANNIRTYGDAPYNLTVTGGGSGNPVTFSSSPAGVVTIVGNQFTIVGAGSTTITASQAGNTNWNAAPNVTQSLTVNKAAQTISFGTLTNRNDVDANFQLTATGGGSGNPVTYTSSLTSVAEIVNGGGTVDPNGDWVDIIAAGQTTITASQAGNANYFAATPVPQVQTIINTQLLPQAITGLSATDTRTYGDALYQLTATGGGSGNPVTYQSLNVAVASITDNLGNPNPNGTYVHLVSNGTATIRASQAGNGTYNPAPNVDQLLTVNQKEITVSGAVASDKPYDGTNAAAITGYTINGIVGTDNITVTGGGTFANVNSGTWAVTAALILGGTNQSKYFLTQPTLANATINPASQTITGLALTDTRAYGAVPYNLTATGGGSGNPVTYSALPAGVVTFVGNQVTIIGSGTTTITASQAGNSNYNAAADVFQTLTVNQSTQTITFAALANKTTADIPFTLTGTASSTLTVSYASSNPAVANVVGNTLTIYGAGVTTITASQAGNANYLPATNVLRTLIVTAPLIAAWDFFGQTSPATFAATLFNANLNSSNLITRGAGAVASSAANSFRTAGFQNNGIAVANTDYFQTTLAVALGKVLSLSDITAKFNGTGTYFATPGVTSQFAYSLNGTTFTLIGLPVTSTSLTMLPVDLTGVSALQNVPSGTTVTIRYYASGQTSTGGWGFSSSAVGDNGLAFGGSINNACAVTGSAITTAVCTGNTDGTATVTLTGSGSGAPGTYSLDAGPATAYSTNPFTITGLAGGAHTIVATVTAGGCVSSSINANVTINPLPTVSFTGLAATYCTTDAAVTLTGSPVGGTFSGTGIVGNTFNPAVAGAGGPYSITYNYTDPGTGCSNSSSQQVTVTICTASTITVNLKLFLQGYYAGAGAMQPVLSSQGVAALATETDTVLVELHDATTFALIGTPQQAVLSTTGLASATFTEAAGSYYIAIKHRNAIQTWSTNPVTCSVSTALYDFSSAANRAMGNNQVEVETGVWAFYTGDLNQDDFIDGNDFPAFDNDSFNGIAQVYVATDMNGDGFVDGNDFPVFDVNSFNGVSSVHP